MSNLKPSLGFPNQTRALLSVKPCHAENIILGIKKYEFRRTIFSRKVDIILLYVSTPVQRVVAEFDVLGIINSSIDRLWKRTKKYAGINENAFYNYFEGREMGHAIEIGEIRMFRKPFRPIDMLGLNPPQSFAYVDSKILSARYARRHFQVLGAE